MLPERVRSPSSPQFDNKMETVITTSICKRFYFSIMDEITSKLKLEEQELSPHTALDLENSPTSDAEVIEELSVLRIEVELFRNQKGNSSEQTMMKIRSIGERNNKF